MESNVFHNESSIEREHSLHSRKARAAAFLFPIVLGATTFLGINAYNERIVAHDRATILYDEGELSVTNAGPENPEVVVQPLQQDITLLQANIKQHEGWSDSDGPAWKAAFIAMVVVGGAAVLESHVNTDRHQ